MREGGGGEGCTLVMHCWVGAIGGGGETALGLRPRFADTRGFKRIAAYCVGHECRMP